MTTYNGRKYAPKITKSEAADIVSATGWLANSPTRFRNELLSRVRVVHFPKDATIYRIDDEPLGIYGLVEGQLRIELDVFEIGEQVAFIAQSGFWVGVSSAIYSRKRSVTLSCASPSTLLFLPTVEFEHLAIDADNMRQFAKLAIENNDMIRSVARDLMNSDIRARIASRLVAICGGGAIRMGHRSMPIEITQADLAMVCNISRKTANQGLAQLEKMGVLSRAYRKLFVTDIEALHRIASGNFARVSARQRISAPASPSVASSIGVSIASAL